MLRMLHLAFLSEFIFLSWTCCHQHIQYHGLLPLWH